MSGFHIDDGRVYRLDLPGLVRDEGIEILRQRVIEINRRIADRQDSLRDLEGRVETMREQAATARRIFSRLTQEKQNLERWLAQLENAEPVDQQPAPSP